jgi:hypothetical protein
LAGYIIRARTGEGRERAKARGVKMGPKFKLTAHQQREAIRRRDTKGGAGARDCPDVQCFSQHDIEASAMSEIQEFLAQLETLKSVWQPFAIALIVLSTCVFFAVDWRYKGVVDAKSATIEQLTAEVGEYKSKLSGASPDEAKAKIERLEQTLKLAIGSRWEPLANDQSNRLLSAISTLQVRRIHIMFENPIGKEPATSIADVFRRARWDVKLSPGAGFETGIVVGWNLLIANQIIHAFESATPLRPHLIDNATEDRPSDLVIIGVGINSAA